MTEVPGSDASLDAVDYALACDSGSDITQRHRIPLFIIGSTQSPARNPSSVQHMTADATGEVMMLLNKTNPPS